jgi:putative NIF3 family GTP cyclohydrolase 1 type 2
MDCKEEIGISWSLAEELGIKVDEQYAEHAGGKVGVYGKLEITQEDFVEKLEQIEPGYNVVGEIENLEEKKIGVIGGSGGALGDLIKDTADQDCEVLIVGNSAFFGDIYAYEKGLTMIEMEETSSEKWGIYRLGQKLEEEFEAVETVKLDEKNW